MSGGAAAYRPMTLLASPSLAASCIMSSAISSCQWCSLCPLVSFPFPQSSHVQDWPWPTSVFSLLLTPVLLHSSRPASRAAQQSSFSLSQLRLRAAPTRRHFYLPCIACILLPLDPYTCLQMFSPLSRSLPPPPSRCSLCRRCRCPTCCLTSPLPSSRLPTSSFLVLPIMPDCRAGGSRRRSWWMCRTSGRAACCHV